MVKIVKRRMTDFNFQSMDKGITLPTGGRSEEGFELEPWCFSRASFGVTLGIERHPSC